MTHLLHYPSRNKKQYGNKYRLSILVQIYHVLLWPILADTHVISCIPNLRRAIQKPWFSATFGGHGSFNVIAGCTLQSSSPFQSLVESLSSSFTCFQFKMADNIRCCTSTSCLPMSPSWWIRKRFSSLILVWSLILVMMYYLFNYRYAILNTVCQFCWLFGPRHQLSTRLIGAKRQHENKFQPTFILFYYN